jgi:hypothetical protein
MVSKKIKAYFDRVVDVVFGVILVFIIIGIAIGAIQLVVETWNLLAFKGGVGSLYRHNRRCSDALRFNRAFSLSGGVF